MSYKHHEKDHGIMRYHNEKWYRIATVGERKIYESGDYPDQAFAQLDTICIALDYAYELFSSWFKFESFEKVEDNE